MYRLTPCFFAISAKVRVATVFIWWLASGLYSAVGSLERPPRLMTAPTFSRMAGEVQRTSPVSNRMRSRNFWIPKGAEEEPVENGDIVTSIEEFLDQNASKIAGAPNHENRLRFTHKRIGRVQFSATGTANECGAAEILWFDTPSGGSGWR